MDKFFFKSPNYQFHLFLKLIPYLRRISRDRIIIKLKGKTVWKNCYDILPASQEWNKQSFSQVSCLRIYYLVERLKPTSCFSSRWYCVVVSCLSNGNPGVQFSSRNLCLSAEMLSSRACARNSRALDRDLDRRYFSLLPRRKCAQPNGRLSERAVRPRALETLIKV